MSATFWNIRRKKAALKKAAEASKPAETAVVNEPAEKPKKGKVKSNA